MILEQKIKAFGLAHATATTRIPQVHAVSVRLAFASFPMSIENPLSGPTYSDSAAAQKRNDIEEMSTKKEWFL